MAKNALHIYHKNQEVNASNSEVSQYQYNSQWMAHWKQKKDSYGLSESSNNEHPPEGHLYIRSIKSRKLKVLNPDLIHEYKNSSRSDSQELGLALYSHPSSTEPLVSENGRMKSNNCGLQKGFKRNDMKMVLSDSLFLQKLPASSLHRKNKGKYQLPDIGYFSSEENPFPMYDINRKIESFLNQQKSFGCVNTTINFSETQDAPENLKPGTEDDLLTVQKTSTCKDIELIKSVKGSSYCHENYRRPRAGEGLSSPLGSLVEKKKDGNLIAKDVKTSQQLEINGFLRVPKSTRLGEYNDCVATHHSVTKIPDCCTRDVETLRILASSSSVNTLNGETQIVSDSFHHGQVNENLTYSLKAKNKALYEMLTLPSTSVSLSKVIVSSKTIGVGDEYDRTDANVSETRSQRSSKPVKFLSDAYEKESPAEALVSDKLHKDLQQQRLMRTHHASKSLAKQGSSGDTDTGVLDSNALCFASSDRTLSIYQREQATSRAESMDAGQALSYVWRPNASSSVGIKKSPSQFDPCRRWLKRLRYNSSDSLQINTDSKRHRVGDGPSTGEICSLLEQAIDYKASQSDMMKTMHLMENPICDETNHLPTKTECINKVTLKQVQCWVGRWCHKETKVASSQEKPVVLLSKPEASKYIQEEPEGKKFPSIGAMALMGKVMSNLHTCEFHKRGSSTVWETEFGNLEKLLNAKHDLRSLCATLGYNAELNK